MRVNAQLIDAESGAHLGSDRFDEDIADLFKLQDQVVARLVNSLGYELIRADAKRGAQSTNPDVVDLTMRGRAVMLEHYPPTQMPTSRLAYRSGKLSTLIRTTPTRWPRMPIRICSITCTAGATYKPITTSSCSQKLSGLSPWIAIIHGPTMSKAAIYLPRAARMRHSPPLMLG